MGYELEQILTPEFKARFEAAAKAAPKPEVSPNNFFSFESFVAIQQFVLKFVHEVVESKATENKELRRQYLQNQQENFYQETVAKHLSVPRQLQNMLMNVYVQVTGIVPNLLNRSAQFYGQMEKMANVMNEFMQKLAIESQDKVGKIIETDACIKALRRLEEAKIASIDTLQKYVQNGSVSQQMAPVIMEIDKCRAVDKLFFDEKIEDDDIGKTIRVNKLHENADFKAMIAEVQAKMQAAQQSWGQ